MHTNRETVGFITILVMTCCFAIGSLASPAAAKTIVVTTLTDSADPPFDADGDCGTGTLSDLPGADGQVSLREAIIAANNTNGKQTITFALNLSGGTIVVNFDDLDADTTPDPLPALCGGQTRIKGDLNDDDVPDITLEGAAFLLPAPPAVPTVAAAAGISVLSSHNTLTGLRVQHFPIGVRILAGDFTTPGTVTHTRVTHNVIAESKLDGIVVATGNIPGPRIAHTTFTHNLVMQNARHSMRIGASLSAAGSESQIHHTTITDNEVRENGSVGIFMFSAGDHNVLSDATIAHNMVFGNTSLGINANGGFNGADGNTLNVRITDNTLTDNGLAGIRVIAGFDNSSNHHVVARIQGNTLGQHRVYGIATNAGYGAANFPTGVSNNNVLDVRIERNLVKSQLGVGILVYGGNGSSDGRAGAVADHNQTRAIVRHNTVENNTVGGIELSAGGVGLASTNTTAVRVAHNTVCYNGADIFGEGGFSGDVLFPANQGTGNVLTGEISKNTATTVTVQDGVLGNTATMTQFHNDPCP